MAPMGDPLLFTVKPVYWTATQKTLRAIRTAVFVEEQGVPPDLEWDGLDEHAYHIVAYAADGTPIGTGRLLQDAQIGRMAVLKEWRRKGVGTALLDMLLVIANKMGYDDVKLHAQTRVLDFYLRKGFAPQGEEFMDAGIPHIAMTRTTVDQTAWPVAFVTRPVPKKPEEKTSVRHLPAAHPLRQKGAR
jgi:predicted GNAT family N-acyltransferase